MSESTPITHSSNLQDIQAFCEVAFCVLASRFRKEHTGFKFKAKT